MNIDSFILILMNIVGLACIQKKKSTLKSTSFFSLLHLSKLCIVLFTQHFFLNILLQLRFIDKCSINLFPTLRTLSMCFTYEYIGGKNVQAYFANYTHPLNIQFSDRDCSTSSMSEKSANKRYFQHLGKLTKK